MVTKYEEIVEARLVVEGSDATYGVQFSREMQEGKTWEFDRNSDAVGQRIRKNTGRIQVLFNPIKRTMKFPEDANRPCTYVMPIEKARDIFKLLSVGNNTSYWFALDMANIASA